MNEEYLKKYRKYEKLADLVEMHSDRVNIYKDNSDGEYFIKTVSGDGVDYDYVDNINSDGNIDYSDNKLIVSDSSFVTIKTFNNDNIRREKGDILGKISVILSYEGMGILQSIFLSRGNTDLFVKLVSRDGFVRGDLEDYDILKSDSCSIIIPVIPRFKEHFDEETKKELASNSRRI